MADGAVVDAGESVHALGVDAGDAMQALGVAAGDAMQALGVAAGDAMQASSLTRGPAGIGGVWCAASCTGSAGGRRLPCSFLSADGAAGGRVGG